MDVDEEFRVRPESFATTMVKCLEEKRPVVQTILVAGSTEYGSVDPIDEIVAIRDRMQSRGVYSPIHVDAAFGGYFAAMFRSGERHQAVGDGELFRHTPWLPAAMRAIGLCDSVTVDPHKAGYVPYGAGCVVHRHGFLRDIVAETAAYVLDSSDVTARKRAIPQLGRFIMEGSKPGAAAAATWFSHRLIPLNMDGYGRQLAVLCRIAREFESSLRAGAGVSENGIHLIPVSPPHTNIVCLYALPDEATKLSEVNALNAAIAGRFGVKDVLSIQSYDYLVSHTRVEAELPYVQLEPRLAGLERDDDALDVLRLVFMNRWVEKTEASGKTYLQDFHDRLVDEARTWWKHRNDPPEPEYVRGR
jgi:glutamate/tyrosine decarboxylase-like PLP-dependent enzyme